jgi:hypothetical protein
MIDSSKGDDGSHVPAGLLKFSHHIFFWRGEGAFGILWVPFSDHRVLILIENGGVKSSLHSAFNGLVMKGQRIEMQRAAGKKFIVRMRLVTCIANRPVGVLTLYINDSGTCRTRYENTNQEIPRYGNVFEGYYQHLPGRREIVIVSAEKSRALDDVGHRVMWLDKDIASSIDGDLKMASVA